ncbi:MAG: MtrB/PioB family decaheme-associated outer membrane protein [Rhodocyclaceae bacterium]|nr:MtrB/PioB family decaheme-associated outer membrane protein [Rhodocyclaceae bacterium]
MNKTMKQTFKLTALAAALATVYGTALADDSEMRQLTKPDSSISVGIGNWSGDRPQQGIYDDMGKSKAYGLVDMSVVKRDDATGTWMTFSGSNLGLDTREIKAEWLRQGDIGASVQFSRTPRDNPLTFTTGLLGVGTAAQTISGTAGANTLPQREVKLGTTRDMTQLGFYKSFSPALELQVTFKNEKKEGARQWGLGSAAYFLTEPINSTTRQIDVVLNYAGERLQLSGGYYGSWYDNANTFALGTIKGAAAGTTSSPGTTPLSLPLDNAAHQIYLNGGYSFSPTTRGNFKLSRGTVTQDESLPRFAAPSAHFTPAPTSLDGKINTTLVEAGLTAQPLPKLSLVGNLRYHDVDDKTPLAGYIGSNATLVPTVYNTPHSIKTKAAKLEATYRLPEDFSLIGGVEYKTQDRSAPTVGTLYVPFVRDLDESTYRLQLRRSLSETANGSLAYLHSKRDASDYVLTNDAEEDAINPMHIADRKRDKWRAVFDWAPAEQWSLQFVVEDATDKYSSGSMPQGLKDGTARLYSLDASYAVNDDWQITGWYSRDENKAKELGSREHSNVSASTNELARIQKEANLREVGDSFGLGIKGTAWSKVKLGGDFEWTRSVTEHAQSAVASGTGAIFPVNNGATSSALPDITNRLVRLKLFAEFAVHKHADVRFDLVHERWRTDDWSWQFSNGTPFVFGNIADGTTVTADAKQQSTFVSARYIYKFQ